MGYRSSAIQKKGYVLLEAYLLLKSGDPKEIRAKIDDFTASGSSFIRIDNDKFDGKLTRFFDAIRGNDIIKSLFVKKYEIHLYFLIATKGALFYIEELLGQYMKKYPDFKIKVGCVQLLDDDAKFTNHTEPDAKAIMEIISDPSYINEQAFTKAYLKSYQEGDKRYYLGYKQCALTVVLNHNTPNNSMPIIWQPKRVEKNKLLYPLFYRITRH